MDLLRRIAPALALLVIAPLIAEFLLGDFNIRQIAYLGIFIPLYGAGALFLRELARRNGRGWPTMLLLALGYGLILEGIVNQTLFNTDYAGQHMLTYGYIPFLGTSLNYGVYIVTLHAVWSVSTPIALAEALSGPRSREPWLGRIGLGVVGILALLGLVGTTVSTIKRFHFVASLPQYASIVLLVATAVFLGFTRFSSCAPVPESRGRSGKFPWMVFVAAFVLSSLFQLWFHFAPSNHLPPALGVAVFLLINTLAVLGLRWGSRQKDWGTRHITAAAMGAVLTYGWFGLRRYLVSGGTAMGVHTKPIDVCGEVLLLVLLLGVGYWAQSRRWVGEAATV